MESERKTIRLIGLDLDGTLLTSAKELTERTRAVLEELSERGIEIVPVTGRPLSGLPPEVRSLPGWLPRKTRWWLFGQSDLSGDQRIYNKKSCPYPQCEK